MAPRLLSAYALDNSRVYYEINEYDTVAFIYAGNQSFTVRKGIVTARG